MDVSRMKVRGRHTAHICKCGATIVVPTIMRTCVTRHVVYADDESVAPEAEIDLEEAKKHLEKKSAQVTDGLCVVCLDVAPEGVFVPCGHLVACMDCLAKINRHLCLICRAPVEQTVKVYTV